jgi:hypothetical protein
MSRARPGRHAFVATLIVAALFRPAQAAPANTLHELFENLGHCLALAAGAPGSELTLQFSLRRDGALLGKPKITHAKLPRDAESQRRFVENVAAAFDRCVPAQITDSLGGAIAGRPLSMRFGVKRRETDI